MATSKREAQNIHRGSHQGWLCKTKGDQARAKWFNSTGRRYFTLDFDNQKLYYAHGEADKNISVPIPFREILRATPGADDMPSVATAPSLVRSLSSVIKAPAGHASRSDCPFTLHTRDRRIRLTADTEQEAFTWIELLNTAHRIGEGLETSRRASAPADRSVLQEDKMCLPSTPTTVASQSTMDGSDAGGACSTAAGSDADSSASPSREDMPVESLSPYGEPASPRRRADEQAEPLPNVAGLSEHFEFQPESRNLDFTPADLGFEDEADDAQISADESGEEDEPFELPPCLLSARPSKNHMREFPITSACPLAPQESSSSTVPARPSVQQQQPANVEEDKARPSVQQQQPAHVEEETARLLDQQQQPAHAEVEADGACHSEVAEATETRERLADLESALPSAPDADHEASDDECATAAQQAAAARMAADLQLLQRPALQQCSLPARKKKLRTRGYAMGDAETVELCSGEAPTRRAQADLRLLRTHQK